MEDFDMNLTPSDKLRIKRLSEDRNEKEIAPYHKIRVDGKKVREKLEKALDQVVILAKSDIRERMYHKLTDLMKEYWDLPVERQVRQIPEQITINVQEFFIRMGKEAQYYKMYRDNPKPVMLINDDKPLDDIKDKTVIPIEYFQDTQPIVENVDMPYTSCAEIMKDTNLSSKEKMDMVNRYLAIDHTIETTTIIEETVEIVDDFNMDSDINKVVELVSQIPNEEAEEETVETENIDVIIAKHMADYIAEDITVEKRFLGLCKKYPQKFSRKRQGRGQRIGWELRKNDHIYKPICITVDPYVMKGYEKQCRADVNTYYLTKTYPIKLDGRDNFIYFVRAYSEND